VPRSVTRCGAAVEGSLKKVMHGEKSLTFWEQAARMATTSHAARPFQSVSTFVYHYLKLSHHCHFETSGERQL
jgi:hypothetical protein